VDEAGGCVAGLVGAGIVIFIVIAIVEALINSATAAIAQIPTWFWVSVVILAIALAGAFVFHLLRKNEESLRKSLNTTRAKRERVEKINKELEIIQSKGPVPLSERDMKTTKDKIEKLVNEKKKLSDEIVRQLQAEIDNLK